MSFHGVPQYCLSSTFAPFILLFFLTCLPIEAFIIFLILYSRLNFIRSIIWRQLFWTVLFILVLPYGLRRLAFWLRVWSDCASDLTERIPAKNAAAAVAFECLVLGRRYWFHVHSNSSSRLMKLVFSYDEIFSRTCQLAKKGGRHN